MNILGLDISTSTVGITVLDENEKLLLIDYLKPKGENLYEKVAVAINEFSSKCGKLNIDKIYAEQPNIMFSKGFSSAQVLSVILRFNGAFLFTLYNKLNILPIEVMASTARKNILGKGIFAAGQAKPTALKFVSEKHLDIQWPLNKKQQLKDECFDMADSYVIAAYGLMNELNSRET